ncbi:MAG: Na+/H+ antiporter NhaC [Deltaproteobacteria bacterium]|jgi:NhaC family Na+:H+ antiporter|nr:Na+/H+ antiporter NhaC [Deltaproteobacteria bacterium]
MENKKTLSLSVALAIIVLPILIILWGGLILKVGFLVPLMLATVVASIIGLATGFSWRQIESYIVNGIHRIIIVMAILFLVGVLIGVWLQAGVIPFFLYWGLKLLSPSIFLASTLVICTIFSIMTGTSFGTVGTAGLALIGVGEALGFPTGMTAGAIVSGAYFGDKMSPVSDTTNFASGVTDTPLFTHIGGMMWTTIPAWVVAFVIYLVLSLSYGGDMPDISAFTNALGAKFNMSIFLVIPPAVLVVLAIRGVPSLPALSIAILAGVLVAFILQDGITVNGIFKAATDGYVSDTGNVLVDRILSRGGLNSMSFIVFLLLLAMTLGGILEGTGALEVVVNRLTMTVKSTGGLILAVVLSCFLMGFGTGNAMLAIAVPARAFAKKFKEKGIQSRVLSRTLEDSATMITPLIPYSMAAFFIIGVLKVDPLDYVPYTFFNYIVPIFTLIYGFTGFAVWKIDDKKKKEAGVSSEAKAKDQEHADF